MSTAVRRLSGQSWRGPSGVADQSRASMSGPRAPLAGGRVHAGGLGLPSASILMSAVTPGSVPRDDADGKAAVLAVGGDVVAALAGQPQPQPAAAPISEAGREVAGQRVREAGPFWKRRQ